MNFNSSGSNNTAVGQAALLTNSTGTNNTGVGYQAGGSISTASYNVAVGSQAFNNGTGEFSVAIGAQALQNSTADFNIGIGYQAGNAVVAGPYNIDIGNLGVANDAGVIRIGTAPNQTSAFIAGITGVTVTGGAQVMVDANGQLGTVSSSRRFKEDIQPMGDATDKLMQLEPVTFRYNPQTAGANVNHDLQYGLIAEQVVSVYPELGVYDKSGQVSTLQYQQLPAMLLNEVQKQHKTIEELERRITELEQALKSNAPAAK